MSEHDMDFVIDASLLSPMLFPARLTLRESPYPFCFKSRKA